MRRGVDERLAAEDLVNHTNAPTRGWRPLEPQHMSRHSDIISRAGAEVAGTPPQTPPHASGRPAVGALAPPNRGVRQQAASGSSGSGSRFSVFRNVLARFGRSQAGGQNASDGPSDTGERPVANAAEPRALGSRPERRGSSRSRRSGDGPVIASNNAAEGILERLQIRREARDLEVALRRSLEDMDAGGDHERSHPSRPPRTTSRGAPAAHDPVLDAGGRLLVPRSGRDQRQPESRQSGVRRGDADGAEADSPSGMVEPRSSHNESAGAVSVAMPGAPQRGLGLDRSDRGHSEQHAAAFLYEAAFGNDEDLQEVLIQSRKAHLLNELPREKYRHDRHGDLTECELCLQDYVDGDELMRLPCLHLFHNSCVGPWLKKSYTCPVCQINVCQAIGL